MLSAFPWTNAAVALLAIVLSVAFDFFFRTKINNRSDPISFTTVSFSAVFVVSDTLFRAARQELDQTWMLSAFVFVLLVFFLLSMSENAQRGLREAQSEKVGQFLEGIRKAQGGPKPGMSRQSDDALWKALRDLGEAMLEPDLARTNPQKRKKRIGFLTTVADLTQVSLDPEVKQHELIVEDATARRYAIAMYSLSLLVGLGGAILFTMLAHK